jgi:two-component system cell cycle response regulator DivK
MVSTALLVEDNALNRLLFAEVLGHAGFSIVADETGERAVALAERWRPAFALVDLGLPRRSGLDVVRALRAHPPTASMPSIVVSAFARPEDEASAYAAGADAYLSKPVDLRRLRALVAPFAACGRRQVA